MDEATVRQALIETCRRLIADWEAGKDWHRKDWFDFDTEDVDIKPSFTDYHSLAATWAYLDSFVDSMNHHFDKLDNVSWEQAFATLKEITGQLEQGLPVQNETANAYLQANNRGCNPFRILFRRRE